MKFGGTSLEWKREGVGGEGVGGERRREDEVEGGGGKRVMIS